MGLTAGPLPARVPAPIKEGLLALVDEAVASGMAHAQACELVGVADDRMHRWRARLRDADTLEDRVPGGHPVHGILDSELEAVLALHDEWGNFDRSHRKLAYRGSRLDTVHVSPSTVRRVLLAHGRQLPGPPPAPPRRRTPFPDWVCWEPNRIWIWDSTKFTACRPRWARAFAIVDVVSRKWIDTLVSVEESASQVKVLFASALEREGLLDQLSAERVDLPPDDPRRPLLLAISDNGSPMTARETRDYLMLLAIVQHFGRPHTPTDQAHIESFFGHVKGEWPYLCALDDIEVLRRELDRVRHLYNGVRLHAGIGYVTPEDEHTGRGDTIRQARRDGLARARRARIEHHRKQQTNHPESRP